MCLSWRVGFSKALDSSIFSLYLAQRTRYVKEGFDELNYHLFFLFLENYVSSLAVTSFPITQSFHEGNEANRLLNLSYKLLENRMNLNLDTTLFCLCIYSPKLRGKAFLKCHKAPTVKLILSKFGG